MGRLVTPAGQGAPFPLPPWGKAKEPSEDTHRVSGNISFSFYNRLPDPAFSPLSPLFPWKAPRVSILQKKPVRHAFVRLQDECGHDIEGTTSAYGNFLFEWTPVNCGTGTITVSTVSASQKSGVAYWLNGPINGPGELTGQTEDYRAHSWSFPFDTNDAAIAAGGLDIENRNMSSQAAVARAFYILDNVMVARWYYNTLPGVSMFYEGPTFGVVYSPGLKPDDVACADWDPSGFLNTAFYSPGKHPGFIYIPAEDDCDFGWEAHAVAHETSHIFQNTFLREAPAYGRFGEGLANVQGAVIRRTKWITGGSGQFENLDVNSRMACWLDGQWDQDLLVDHSVAKDACTAAGGIAGFPVAAVFDPSTVDTGWFQRVVWDLVDGGELDGEPLLSFVPEGMSPDECGGGGAPCAVEQFDLVTGQGGDGIALPGSAPLNDVLIFYLGGTAAMGTNPNYVDRGEPGLDLVDVLDGMVCRGHMTVDEVQVLYGAMGFDYNGLGPALCPHPFD
jgi:hypothetical protein